MPLPGARVPIIADRYLLSRAMWGESPDPIAVRPAVLCGLTLSFSSRYSHYCSVGVAFYFYLRARGRYVRAYPGRGRPGVSLGTLP